MGGFLQELAGHVIPPLADGCWVLTGPTGSGKTDVGIELALLLDAEIVSMDSMALYRGMDIGTAKPTAKQRRRIAHHLLDVADPWQEYSLADYVRSAHACVAEIVGRGRQALLVGGTPLYLKALLRGMFEGPSADAALRRRLRAEAAQREPGWLHRRLTEIDPAAAARLHPNDVKRIVRAIEVHEKTGRPLSAWQQQFDRGRAADQCRVFVLDWPRKELHERIDRRVEAMFAAGLVEEVRSLLGGPAPLGPTARQAVGYREVIDHLEGRSPLGETVELVQRHTRQIAKRQMTWFRSLDECRFVAMHAGWRASEVAAAIARPVPEVAGRRDRSEDLRGE